MRVGVALLVMASAASGVVQATACSSFGSSDSPATPPQPSADAADSANDAALPNDGGVDQGSGPTTLISESFETDKGLCSEWEGRNATAIARVADAGTDGSYACRVCSDFPKNSYFGVVATIVKEALPKESHYTLEASVRLESGPANTAFSAAFSVDDMSFDEGLKLSAAGWNRVAHRLDLPAGSTAAAFVSGIAVATPTCIVIDDIVVRRLD